MRRFVYWYLPLSAGLIAACVFAYGFASYLAGNRGEPVNAVPRPTAAAPLPSRILTPVILGDSLARGAGDERGLGISGRLDRELRARRIRAAVTTNLGVNGARTPDLLRQLDSANVQRIVRISNVVIISIGGNDLWGGTDWRGVEPGVAEARMGDVLSRIDEIIARVRKASPHARIFFIGLYNPFVSTPEGKMLTPFINRWNARLLEKLGSDPDFTLVPTSDLFSHRDRLSVDRFHPGGDGYELIAKRIAEAL